MLARLAAVIVALAAASCHRECRARLAELARFYRAVAAEQLASPSRMAVRIAREHAGADELVTISGPPAETSSSDVLVVGREHTILVPVEGDGLERWLDGDDLDQIFPGGKTSSLVIEIGADTPARAVARIVRRLARPDEFGYKTIAIGYRGEDAFAGRVPPKIPGFRPGDVDLGQAGRTISEAASAHCAALAVKLAHLDSTALTPGVLSELAPTLSSCDCSVDLAPLEALPWMLREPVVTVVPLARSAPPVPEVDTTWAELVRKNGGKPPAVALPPRPPPPPRPPRPR